MNSIAEDKLLTSINNIKSTISEKDQLLWRSQAITRCYSDAKERITEKSDQLRKKITKIETEIKDIQPQVKLLQDSYKNQQKIITIAHQSILIYRSHKKQLEDDLKKKENERNHIRNEYDQEFQNIKKQLEKTNPEYQIVQEKRAELMKCQVRCKILEAKIVQNRNIIDGKKEIFYAGFVSLARTWLTRREFLRNEIRVIELKKTEVEWMKKLTEIQDILKKKQELAYTKKDNIHRMDQFDPMKLQMTQKANILIPQKVDISQLGGVRSLVNKAEEKRSDKNGKNINDLQNLIKQSGREIKPIDYPQKANYNANHSKVTIIENKILIPAQEALKPTVPVLDKKERSRAIDAKLQKVVQKMSQNKSRKKSWYFHNSQSSHLKSRPSSQNDLNHSFDAAQSSQVSKNEIEDVNINIISQEESDIRFISQLSQNNLSNVLENPINTGLTSKSTTNYQIVNHFDPRAAINKLPSNFEGEIQNKTAYKKPLVGTNQFKINFKMSEALPNTAIPFNMNSNNADDEFDNTFKKPVNDAAQGKPANTINLAPEQTASVNPLNAKENNSNVMNQSVINPGLQMKIGETQYDFGNITQFSLISDYNGEYDASYAMSPGYDLKSPPPNPEMSMGFGNFTENKPFEFSGFKF